MKALSALLSALVVVGFAGSAAAECASYAKPAADQSAVVLPEGSVGS